MKTKEFWKKVHSGEIGEGDTIVSTWTRSGKTQTCKVEYVLKEMLASPGEGVEATDLMIGNSDMCHFESSSRWEEKDDLVEYVINP